MSLETLNALRLSILTQLKTVEGTGQSHSASGRQTAMPTYDALMSRLADIEAAISFKSNAANDGNSGYARRFASFNASSNAQDPYP